MAEHTWLAERFETNRVQMQAVAYRMLGSQSEAEDAVQEAWFRLVRSDTTDIANLGGWLTTVVGRICLDTLRTRGSRREEPLDVHEVEQLMSRDTEGNPEHEALLADSVGLALLVVLDTLTPAERLAFVLHDVFAVPFDAIAPSVERSPAARGSWRAAHVSGSAAQPPLPLSTSPSKGLLSRPFWRPHAKGTSRRCSRCSIPMSCCAPTTQRWRWVVQRRCGA